MGKTVVAIEAQAFLINGQPTYPGRTYRGMKVEGLLLNARLVQGIFDDLNPQTRGLWDYPDGPWDPERNTAEFIQAMPAWRARGLVSFTINLQGGSPQGYSKDQPWHDSAFESDGRLREDYLARLERILEAADELGMVPILGLFYFGQDHRLADEAAVVRATGEATDWLCRKGYTHVLVEIGNEVDHSRYRHEIIRPPGLCAAQLTTLMGLPARNALMFSAVAAIRRRRAASVAQAMCGVMMQFLADSRGLSMWMGSADTTSTAAPAMRSALRASARSCSTTRPPRAVLMSNALGFIRSSSARSTRPLVESVWGQCRETTSAAAKSSSSSSHRKGS